MKKDYINIEQVFNDREYYEIRLESIGGLGANLCGKMVGELAVRYLGLNSAGFSSYGSEKTGTPVKLRVRRCHPQPKMLKNTVFRMPPQGGGIRNPPLQILFSIL